MKNTYKIASCLATAALVSTASAAITITQVSPATSQTVSKALDMSFDVINASSWLVVGVYGDSGTPGFNTPDFGGVAPTASYFDSRVAVFIFANPSTASALDFSITTTSANGLGAVAYEVAGADLTLATVAVSNSTSSVTTTADNEFLFSFAGRNSPAEPTLDAASILTLDRSIPDDLEGVEKITGDGSLTAASGAAGTAGAQNLAWINANDGLITLSFDAVPEPSTTALLGLGGLALILRRRK
jgi:hypothetical protein